MNTYLQLGSSIVVFALASYSIGVITEQRKKVVSKFVLTFITLGVTLDIIATVFMILGTSKTGITLHGVIGYSSLFVMLLDAILLWRYRMKNGLGASINKTLHLYTRYAYTWWVLAFITGLLLVVFK